MELRETIESINEKLISEFGLEFNGQPRFRVVWSDDQFEKRWTNYTDEGFELINPEVREIPKYRQWIQGRYILERLVPIVGESDLTEQIGYESAWVFQDRFQNYLPPYFDGCKFVIESIYSAIDKKGMHVKYQDPEVSAEFREQRLKRVEKDLFGNETDAGDALAYGSGVAGFHQKVEIPTSAIAEKAAKEI